MTWLLAILAQLQLVLQVVVAIRHAEPALVEIQDVVIRLPGVAVGVPDHRVDQVQLEEPREMSRQVLLGLDRVDRGQLRRDGREASSSTFASFMKLS